jgi:archaellum component FlaC
MSELHSFREVKESISTVNSEIRVLQSRIKDLQDRYQLLLDHLNLVVKQIPAQPARQELQQKGKDGENELYGGAAGW